MFNKAILTLILVIGIISRILFVNNFPPSLNWDEVSLGYNSYSVLNTGKDEWGFTTPTLFRAFGDFKLPGYVYLSTPFIYMLGLTALSVRLTSVIAGSMLILVVYCLSRSINRSAFESLLVSFLVAISPWTLFLSRVAVEANLSLLFVTLAVTLFIRKRFSISFLFFGLSVWTYNSARVFVPLFLMSLLLLHLKRLRIRLLPLMVLLFFVSPMLIQLFQTSGQARFKWLSLVDASAVGTIEQLRNSSNLPESVDKLLYNRPVYFVYKFASNFVSYFSPDFLFINGGSHYQFSLPGHGLVYSISLPFFYIGLILLIKNLSKSNSKSIYILLWILIAAVPGSIVKDAPHSLRSIYMSIPVILIVGMSFSWFYRLLLHKFVIWVVLLAISLQFAIYCSSFVQYSKSYSWAWQYGNRQLVDYAKKHYQEFDQIIITKRYGEPHEFVLFYWPWNPSKLQNDSQLVRYFRTDWYWTDGFDKFRFVNDWEMPTITSKLDPNMKYLIFSGPENIPPATLKSTINFLDNKTAYNILEY